MSVDIGEIGASIKDRAVSAVRSPHHSRLTETSTQKHSRQSQEGRLGDFTQQQQARYEATYKLQESQRKAEAARLAQQVKDSSPKDVFATLAGKVSKPSEPTDVTTAPEQERTEDLRTWFERTADKVEATRADINLRKSGKHKYSYRSQQEDYPGQWEHTFAYWMRNSSEKSGEISERLRLLSNSGNDYDRQLASALLKRFKPDRHSQQPKEFAPGSLGYIPNEEHEADKYLTAKPLYVLQSDVEFSTPNPDPALTKVINLEGTQVTQRVANLIQNTKAMYDKFGKHMGHPNGMPHEEARQFWTFIEEHPDYTVW